MCWLSFFLQGFSGRVRGKDPVEELQVTDTLEVDLKYKGLHYSMNSRNCSSWGVKTKTWMMGLILSTWYFSHFETMQKLKRRKERAVWSANISVQHMTGDKLCSVQSMWQYKTFQDIYNYNILKCKRNTNWCQWRKYYFLQPSDPTPNYFECSASHSTFTLFCGQESPVEKQKAHCHMAV